jgi:hypothetical protein
MMVRILLKSIVGLERGEQEIYSLAIVHTRQAAWKTLDHLLDSQREIC